MKANELRSLDTNELEARLKDFRQEHMNLRFRHATAQLDNTASLKLIKKKVARVMTVIQQRKSKGQDA
ncbi:large subunit ribosomal protein L29 [Desulfobotulus alkaliphilus]|uniref:Large ribosomal subunit protein uL29 n=1 Tax=Desulfobotulus alkaliphilus TaxID=622671 RepID=A0A562RRC9_9BACT|nr:50S ribosomal protein L29 [Desulfobotulus alkaliphilus]TWI71631.1 large subunit ribosomal protein L29 [Desulfobotulus alkaliphilus]